MSDAAEPVPSARALLKERDYLLFWGTRWTGSFATQIQSVAMGWHMYAIARQSYSVNESALIVSMLGLAAFVPVLLLALPAGEVADRYDRRKVMILCLTSEILSVLTLAVATVQGWASIPLLLGVWPLTSTPRSKENSTTPTPSLNSDSPAMTSSTSFGAPADLRIPSTAIGSVGEISAPNRRQ